MGILHLIPVAFLQFLSQRGPLMLPHRAVEEQRALQHGAVEEQKALPHQALEEQKAETLSDTAVSISKFPVILRVSETFIISLLLSI